MAADTPRDVQPILIFVLSTDSHRVRRLQCTRRQRRCCAPANSVFACRWSTVTRLTRRRKSQVKAAAKDVLKIFFCCSRRLKLKLEVRSGNLASKVRGSKCLSADGLRIVGCDTAFGTGSHACER